MQTGETTVLLLLLLGLSATAMFIYLSVRLSPRPRNERSRLGADATKGVTDVSSFVKNSPHVKFVLAVKPTRDVHKRATLVGFMDSLLVLLTLYSAVAII